MYRLVEYEILPQRHEEIRHQAAVERQTTVAPEKRETRPYVVRDLSWEFARYLDTQDFSASVSATSNSVSGHHGRTPEERVSG